MVYVRFWRRSRILPHVFLNVSKRSVSFSFISRFITMTLGRYGIRLTSGLKGTGLSFTELIRRNKK